MSDLTENTGYFDNLSDSWDQDSMRSRIALNVARTIHQLLPPLRGAAMLDFGCGTGLLSFYFYPHLSRLDGVDTSPGMVEQFNRKAEAEQFNNAKARILDFEEENIPEDVYDVIVSSMVFHHIRYPAETLGKLYTALKSGGRIAIADLDEEDGTFHPPGIQGVYHHGFSRDTVIDWFKESGFVNITVKTVMRFEKENKPYSIFLCFGEKK